MKERGFCVKKKLCENISGGLVIKRQTDSFPSTSHATSFHQFL